MCIRDRAHGGDDLAVATVVAVRGTVEDEAADLAEAEGAEEASAEAGEEDEGTESSE